MGLCQRTFQIAFQNFDVNGYDTRGSDMDLYLPTHRKDAYRKSITYIGGEL